MENTCTHLDQVHEIAPSSEGCEDCLRAGQKWVHLRMCMTCGHVGCCDESVGRHATQHFNTTDHPIMRSLEHGEDWMWCFKDQALLYATSDEPTELRLAATKSFLRPLPLFSQLSEDDLNRLSDMARPTTIRTGEVLMEEGSPGDALYVVLDGEFEVTKHSGKQDVVLSRRGPGQMLGEMSLFEQAPRMATVRAIQDSRVLVISNEAFNSLLAYNPQAVLAILRTVVARLRSTETLLVQNEKMASLGTLAAGLAHELNNPAAAVRRSTDQLRDVLATSEKAASALYSEALDTAQTEYLNDLRTELQQRAAHPPILDPLARSDLESTLQDWLDERGVEDAWDYAPVLVSAGLGTEDAESLAEHFSAEQLPAVVSWLASSISAYSLLNEVTSGAERISEIVKAIKTYSYLDQAPIQKVNIHEGLENTLIILKHKLKEGVTVLRDYAPNLPEIEAYGSELNQVWTNLIDNAIDAMHGKGEIRIKTSVSNDRVIVEIADNGPGIPPDVQPRVFEPFFTTKEPGSGTGLGLHIAYNIVVDKHHGSISVQSEPGRTSFEVRLPIKLVRE